MIKAKMKQDSSAAKKPTLEKVGKFLDMLPLEDKLALRIKIAKEGGDRVSEAEVAKQLAKYRLESYSGSDIGSPSYLKLYNSANESGVSADEIEKIAKQQVSIILDYGDLGNYRFAQFPIEKDPWLTKHGERQKAVRERRLSETISSDLIRFIQGSMPGMLPALRSEIELRLDFLISSSYPRTTENYARSDFFTSQARHFLDQMSFWVEGFADIAETYAPKLIHVMAANYLVDAAPTARQYGLVGLAKSLALDAIAGFIECGSGDPFEFAKTFGISKAEISKIAKKVYSKHIADGQYMYALDLAVKYHFIKETKVAAKHVIRQHILECEFSCAIDASIAHKLLKFFENEVVSAHKDLAVAVYLIKNEMYGLLSGFKSFQIDKIAIAKDMVAAEILAGHHLKALSMAEHWHLKDETKTCLEYLIGRLIKREESV